MVEVNAIEINKIHVKYECPFCLTIRGGRIIPNNPINLTKYRSANNTIHFHGSAGDLSNRVEHRTPHCNFSNEEVHINITDSTKRT